MTSKKPKAPVAKQPLALAKKPGTLVKKPGTLAEKKAALRRGPGAPSREEALALPGLTAGRVELIGDDEQYRVRLTSGELIRAELGQGVEPDLVADCLTHQRVVLLIQGAQGPVILGALQTGLTPQVDAHGELSLRAKRVSIEAAEHFQVKAGREGSANTSLELESDGVIQVRGERLHIHATANLRIGSALVELP